MNIKVEFEWTVDTSDRAYIARYGVKRFLEARVDFDSLEDEELVIHEFRMTDC